MSRNQFGFSLVELLIAMVIILIGVTAIVPLYVYITHASESNRMRTVATNLANEVLEDIRSKEFYDVGVVGSDPVGLFLQSEDRLIDGKNYRVQVFINWIEEGSSCLSSEGQPGQGSWDYKGVKVIVTATSVFTNEEMITATADTIIARDSAQPAQPGANIRTCIFRGWRPDPEVYDPVSSVQVDLTLETGATSSIWSTSKGSTMFVNRPVGNHTITVNPSTLGMIAEPETSPFTVEATAASTSTKLVYVEFPCSISVQLVDDEGEAIVGSGRLILETPFKDTDDEVINITNDFAEAQELVLVTGIWPVGTGYSGAYNIKIENVDGYENYDMSIADIKPLLENGVAWDGKFSAPGTEIDLTVTLEKEGVPYIKVQRGELSFAPAITVQTVDIDPVNSINRAFIQLSQRGASGNVSRAYYTAKFISASQIEIQRGAGETAGAVVWQVIEASDEVAVPAFEVQTGEVTLNGSELSNVVATITDVEEQGQCVVFITTRGTASHNNRHQLLVRGSLNTPTELGLYRAASGSPVIVRWWVVKFSNAFSIQKGSIVIDGTTKNQTIAATDQDRSAVFITWDADTNGLSQTSPRVWLDSPTEIRVDRASQQGTCNIDYAVVQFPEGVIVQADNNTGSPSTIGNSATKSISQINPGNTILIASNKCTGTGTAFPRPVTTWRLASPDSLEFRTDYNDQTNTWSYFAIDTAGWTD